MAAIPPSAIIFLLGIASRKKNNRSSRAADFNIEQAEVITIKFVIP